MAKKSGILLVVSLSVLFFFASSTAGAKDLIISGSVHFEDGVPVRGATLVFTQLNGFFFSKPRPLGVGVTDADGRFKFQVESPKGSVDIRLVEDRCSWTSAIALVDVKKHINIGSAAIELVPRRKKCEQ